MVFSKATGYGIRAMSYMARHGGDVGVCGLGEIASSEKIPQDYLRKLLGELRRHRLVRSVKGVHGGYLLAHEPQNITLWDVFKALDNDPYLDECIFCGARGENLSCSFCAEWKRICNELVATLKKQTIADFALD